MWHQRAKDKWLKEGDANTKFFHLSSTIHKRLECQDLFKGIKISRGSPPISHIMYADDIVIFGSVREDNVCQIAECISEYESWSGQQVSKEKSVIHFSKNMSKVDKQRICNQLGFRECNHKMKHLGLPFCKSPSKVSDFSNLIDRIEKKLSGWKSKCLAHVGRNVLIKGVAQAIPIYFMTLTLLPLSVCDRIDRLMRNFWWGDSDVKTKLRLRSWDFICSPKKFGGLGMRKTRDMNQALITKLAWSLCDDNPLLWANLLKSKYLRGTHFLDQNETPRTSSKIWKSICCCKDSVLKGLCFSVSRTSFVRTWKDPWIPTLPHFRPNHEPPSESLAASTFFVSFLIDPISNEWNVPLIFNVFHLSVAFEILKIRIPSLMEPRKILWTPSKNGFFSVSSSYLLDHSERFDLNRRGDEVFWKFFWKSHIHERFKMFLWRILTKSIPTASRLHRIFPDIDPTCLICKDEMESEEHAFFLCPKARSAWWRSKWGFKTEEFKDKSMFEFVNLLLQKNSPFFPDNDSGLEFLQFACCLMELLWQNRNNLLHGKMELSIDRLVKLAESKSIDHFHSLKSSSRLSGPKECGKVSMSSSDCIVVSIDAAYVNGKMCSGMIVRDIDGSILFAAARSNYAIDAKYAEFKLLKMLLLTWRKLLSLIFVLRMIVWAQSKGLLIMMKIN